MAVGLRLVDDYGVEQALSAHGLDNRALDSLQSLAENFPERLGLLDHLLLADDFQSANGNRTTQRIAAVGGAVRTGLDGEHDILAAQNAGHRVHAARDSLAQQDQVGLDSAPFMAEELSRAGDARLDLVADQQGVVLVAQRSGFAQVVIVWDDNARLALNRLDKESS